MEVEATVGAVVGQKRASRQRGAENGKPSKKGKGGVGSGSGESENEVHMWTERERRKKMRNMFASLHALLPQLPPKADKSTVVDEAVKYIKSLQQILQTLEKKRTEKYQRSATVEYEPSVVTMQAGTAECRDQAFLAPQGPSNSSYPVTTSSMPHSFPLTLSPACFRSWFSPNVVINMCGDDAQFSVCAPGKPGLLTIFYILEKHSIDVVAAHISSDQYRSLYMIHAHFSGVPEQYPEALSVEDAFKLAAGEMNLWLMSC